MAESFDEMMEIYEELLSQHEGVNVETMEEYYESYTGIMFKEFNESEFMEKLRTNIKYYDDDYLSKYSYKLFEDRDFFRIKIKPYKSVIEKCFRKDILSKKAYDLFIEKKYDVILDEYIQCTPFNCYDEFEDIIRTRATVKYMDGAHYLLDKLKELILKCGLKCSNEYKAEDDGYYAVHIDLFYDFEIPDIYMNTISIKSRIEIQINSAIQNLLINLTHPYYEVSRKRPRKSMIKWQWAYDCDEFIPNYLGHIIHYVEGMMMNIKENK